MRYACCLVLMSCVPDDPSPLPNEPPARAQLAITANADPEADTGCFDGLAVSRQTPSALQAGVNAIELLHDATETNGYVLRGGDIVEEDLIAGATFSRTDIESIPEGEYSHVRISFTSITATVDAVAHPPEPGPVAGHLEIDYALSDHTSEDLGERLQGDYFATFSSFGTEVSQAGHADVDSFATPYPGSTVSTAGNKYEVLLTIPWTVVIDHNEPIHHDLHITLDIGGAFGWFDIDAPGFSDGVFDTASHAHDTIAGVCINQMSLDAP